MSAMSTSTSDSSCWFGAALTKTVHCSKVNVVKVYHNFNEKFRFYPLFPDSVKFLRDEDPLGGYTSFRFSRLFDSISFRLVRKDSLAGEFTLFGFSFENDKAPGYYLAALGSNGAHTGSFLLCSRLAEQLASLKPDLVIFSLGVNDTQLPGYSQRVFTANYDSLIRIVKRAAPGVAILLTTTTDNYVRRKRPNKRSQSAREAMLELLNTHQLALWDTYGIMGDYKSIVKWQKAGLAAKDRVHFNTRGYELLASMLFDALEGTRQQFLRKRKK